MKVFLFASLYNNAENYGANLIFAESFNEAMEVFKDGIKNITSYEVIEATDLILKHFEPKKVK